jgi:hypothetical protein
VSSILRWEYHVFGRGWDKDGASWVGTLTDKEPLEVMKAHVDSIWEIVRQYILNGLNSVRGKDECTLSGNGHGGTS